MLLAAVYRHWPLRPLADRFRRQQFFRTLTAGAIQYIEQPFYRLLGGLRSPPRHVPVNRLPVHFTVSDLVTLQNTGKAITTCRA